MIHPISFIGRKLRRKKKYNILCFPTHEGYQSNLDKTGHNFLMVNAPNMKQWDYHTRPLPKNHYIINLIDQSPIFNFEVDLILSQERTTQLPMALDMQRLSGAPVIHLEHTEPELSFQTSREVTLEFFGWRESYQAYIGEMFPVPGYPLLREVGKTNAFTIVPVGFGRVVVSIKDAPKR
jgi:hypothetical protein